MQCENTPTGDKNRTNEDRFCSDETINLSVNIVQHCCSSRGHRR